MAYRSVYHSHPLNMRPWAERFHGYGQRVPFLFFIYGIEIGSSSRSPLVSHLKYSLRLASQEYKYCWDKSYLLHLFRIPLLEVLRVFSFWKGLRAGMAEFGCVWQSGSRSGRPHVGVRRGTDGS